MAWSSLIDILTRGRRVGYLVRETHSLAFFSNNTLCLRRSMVEQIGLYDPDLQASEDVDICARIARDRWFIYKCPDMVLFHRPRPNLVSLLRQWWGYGLNIPKVYRKYSPGHLELYVYWPPNRFLQLLQRDELPFTCCLFVHPFLVMHLLGLAANLMHSKVLALLALVSALLYVLPDLSGGLGWRSFKVGCIRYLLNWVFSLSHLVGAWKYRCLYLPNVVSERRDGSEFVLTQDGSPSSW